MDIAATAHHLIMLYDTIIIGAGAAGLMCAAQAGRRGRRVLVMEHRAKAGEKIRISGGGRCNFTNLYTTAHDYISNNPHFCKSALARFTPYDIIAMLDDAGISWHEREHGQLFCDHSAQQVTDMLLQHGAQAGVHMQYQCEVQQVSKQNDLFHLKASCGSYQSKALVIATGGLSIPKIGATSFGHKIAQQFGLNLIPTRPALVPFRLTGKQHDVLKQLAGTALSVEVRCRGTSFQEAMLLTHRGLSGPAILQISSYWQDGDTLDIHLLPGVDVEQWLQTQQKAHPKQMLHTILAKQLSKRLALYLCQHELPDVSMQQLSTSQLQHISQSLQHWHIKPSGTEGYRTAEATLGGVDTRELSSKTMESNKVAGLYFIGEVMDVTGHLGGFNFQWAWASGYAAGQAL